MARTLWILMALTGAALAAAFLFRLRFRLRHRSIHRPEGDGWQRGWPALLGFGLSLLAMGMGLGGTLAWRSSTAVWAEFGAALVEIGPEPLPDEEVAEPGPLRPEPQDPERARPGESESAWEEVSPPQAPGEETDTQAGETASPASTSRSVSEDASQVDSGSRPAPAAEIRFGVRVGVFRSRSNAEEVVNELRESGLAPLVAQRATNDGEPLYYVYAGTFETRERAETAAVAVRNLGLEVLVVEMAPLPQG